MRTSKKRALDAVRRRVERDTRLDELAEAEGDDIVGGHDSAWEPYDYRHDPERNTEYRSELRDLTDEVPSTPGAAERLAAEVERRNRQQRDEERDD